MTNEKVIEYAKFIQEFCRKTDCRQCPFGKPSEYTKIVFCKLTDDEEPPCGWNLEEEER